MPADHGLNLISVHSVLIDCHEEESALMSSNAVNFCPQHVQEGLPGGKRSRNREESQDLAHDAIALIGLEQKLSVSGTVQND